MFDSNDVLLDSLEDALKTPRSWDTYKAAGDFKLCTEFPPGMSNTLLLKTMPLPKVRNQWRPLRLLGGYTVDTKKMGDF